MKEYDAIYYGESGYCGQEKVTAQQGGEALVKAEAKLAEYGAIEVAVTRGFGKESEVFFRDHTGDLYVRVGDNSHWYENAKKVEG